jgi:hypothetical protein
MLAMCGRRAMPPRAARIGDAGSPADFAALIAADTAKWAEVVKFTGARAE